MIYDEILNNLEKECKFIQGFDGYKVFKDNFLVGFITKNTITLQFKRLRFNNKIEKVLISFVKNFITIDSKDNLEVCDIVTITDNFEDRLFYVTSNGINMDLVPLFGYFKVVEGSYGDVKTEVYDYVFNVAGMDINISRGTLNPKGYDYFDAISILEKHDRNNLKCDLLNIKNKILNMTNSDSDYKSIYKNQDYKVNIK